MVVLLTKVRMTSLYIAFSTYYKNYISTVRPQSLMVIRNYTKTTSTGSEKRCDETVYVCVFFHSDSSEEKKVRRRRKVVVKSSGENRCKNGTSS